MPQGSMQELIALAGTVKQFLSTHIVDFLEIEHTGRIAKKLNHAAASEMLKPVEAFELDVKNNMSNAAHEILQAANRIEDCQRQHSELDTVDFLRYARTNLEESAKDLEAAEHAHKALEKYYSRVEKASVVLGKEVESIATEIFNKLEQLKTFQKDLFEKTVMLINDVRGE